MNLEPGLLPTSNFWFTKKIVIYIIISIWQFIYTCSLFLLDAQHGFTTRVYFQLQTVLFIQFLVLPPERVFELPASIL